MRSISLVVDLIDLVTKQKSGELRCPATALIFSAVSCQKLSSMYSNQILMKDTRLESFSFPNVCSHPCENTVPVKIA